MARTQSVMKRTIPDERSAQISAEVVARVAYELFLRRGGVHGYDRQDWYEAERVVRKQRRIPTVDDRTPKRPRDGTVLAGAVRPRS